MTPLSTVPAPFFFLVQLLIVVVVIYLIYSFAVPQKRQELGEKAEKISFPKKFGWTLGLGIVGFNLFAYEVTFGIGLGLFYIALVLGLLISLPQEKRGLLPYSIAILGIASSALFGLRSNEFVQVVNWIVAELTLFALWGFHVVPQIKWEGLALVNHVFHMIEGSVRQVPVLLTSIFTKNKKGRSLLNIVKTVLITLVIVFFFAQLLSKADPIFEQLIREIKEDVVDRTLISLLITLIFAVILSISLKAKTTQKSILEALSFHDALLPLIGTVLLFGLFLFVQFKYLFGAHDNFQSFDLTYSEYVRKGFLEMLVSTFFGGLLAYSIILKGKTLTENNKGHSLQIVNTLLILELFLMLVSAFKRDWLYMDVYGLTRVRLIGGIFLIWLAGFLMLVLGLNLWKRWKESHFLTGIYALSIGVLILINALNIDGLIAHATPPQNAKRDFFYINQLSEDAVSAWKESIEYAQKEFSTLLSQTPPSTPEAKMTLAESKLAMVTLQQKRYHLDRKYGDAEQTKKWQEKWHRDYYYPENEDERLHKWQSWVWSEVQAYRFMNQTENKALFYDTVDCLMEEIEDYQIVNKVELVEQEQERLYNYEYPFVQTRHDRYYYPKSIEEMRQEEEMWLQTQGPYPPHVKIVPIPIAPEAPSTTLPLPTVESCK